MKVPALAPSWSHRFRLSLRMLMAVVLVLGMVLGWIVHRARVQRQAVAAIERGAGGFSMTGSGKTSVRSRTATRAALDG